MFVVHHHSIATRIAILFLCHVLTHVTLTDRNYVKPSYFVNFRLHFIFEIC